MIDPHEILCTHFDRYLALDEVERNALRERSSVRRLKKRGFLLQEGEVCKSYAFVVEGCLRMYEMDEKGVEHNLQFALENEWIVDIGSFHAEKPSSLFIEALEPSTVICIEHADLLYLYTEHPKFDRNFRVIIEDQFVELQQRMLRRNASSAEQRHAHFVEQHPALAARVPNVHIASYLGVTPEFLSRLKSKTSKGR
ncbi:MAG: Crp/Fnr family transcriptional regulator [Flavobacteriales bacterium]|nr:Crp/Fnr family transcriptional regulator [Flavobacteriales bacterium]